MTYPICDLVGDGLDLGETRKRLLEDHWPEDGHPDYLGLKRELEDEFDVDLTLTQTKQHVDDHVRYSWGGGGA